MYEYFVRSNFRWKELENHLDDGDSVLKRATGTRWSAKNDAIQALHSSFLKVLNVLLSFLDESCTQDNKSKAKSKELIKKLCRFDHIFMLTLWKQILSQFNRVSLALQRSTLTISIASGLYQTLIGFIQNLKKEFDSIFDETTKLAEEVKNISIDFILTRSTRETMDLEAKKRSIHDTVFLPIVDALLSNLKKRHETIHEIDKNFSFLLHLKVMSHDQITEACQKIVSVYTSDLNLSELTDECILAKSYPEFENLTHETMYKILFRDNINFTFPNLEILLRIYLCLFVTNVSTETSFSKLKLIKNYLRNSMEEDRLNALALLSIESEVMDNLQFEDIMETFIHAKRRKNPL